MCAVGWPSSITALYRLLYQDWTKEAALDDMQNGTFGHYAVWGKSRATSATLPSRRRAGWWNRRKTIRARQAMDKTTAATR